jgi:hypothetical protein
MIPPLVGAPAAKEYAVTSAGGAFGIDRCDLGSAIAFGNGAEVPGSAFGVGRELGPGNRLGDVTAAIGEYWRVLLHTKTKQGRSRIEQTELSAFRPR